MIHIQEKQECCGCNACVQKCPKQCITMKTDREGFWYPEVDEGKCIACNACVKVCPIIGTKDIRPGKSDPPLAFAVFSRNSDLRENSSSGGVFSMVAQEVLRQGGVVFGAAFDQEWQVHHICVESPEELDKLRGSKYLQSRIENTFAEAKKRLDSGRAVLFSGTGCQIEGLLKFLGKAYDNLFTIDILCHGVPSPKVWEKYIHTQEAQHHAKVKNANFRSKRRGWKRFSMELEFDDQSIYSEPLDQDLFMQLFLRNICLRPSCHDCRFKDWNRRSDITIGDFWGIEKMLPEIDDDRGISLVLVHSAKGKQMLEKLRSQIQIREVNPEDALPPTADSRHSVDEHRNRTMFFKKLDHTEFDRLEKYLKEPVKARIKGKIKRTVKKIIRK